MPLAGAPQLTKSSGGSSWTKKVLEAGDLWDEAHVDGADGAVAVLGDQQLGDLILPGVAVRGVHHEVVLELALVVHIGAVDEDDDVGVLLDRAALTQVAELRDGRPAALNGAGELGEREHRHVQLAGELFERARDDAELGDAVGLDRVTRPGMDELDVVDDDQAKALLIGALGGAALALVEQALVQVARLRADLGERLAGGVIDIHLGAAERPDCAGNLGLLLVGVLADAQAAVLNAWTRPKRVARRPVRRTFRG